MSNRSAGRSGATTTAFSSSTPTKLSLNTNNLPLAANVSRNAASRAGAYSPSPISPDRDHSYSHSRSHVKADMSHYSTSNPLDAPSAPKLSTSSTHAKLHKRRTSSSSASGPASPPTIGLSQFATPFATLEDPFPDVAPSPSSSVPKIKPYLRKMSTTKEDQGMIDLSKSTSENDRLAGLGIQDFATKSASEVNFVHSRKSQQHGRTTSNGSQVSNSSVRLASTQPFVHPMAKTPRPYTPSAGASYASSLNEQEANESGDIIEDDFRFGNAFRTTRSTSISSTPAFNPTPLYQSHTASELGLVPKLTSISQTNLSFTSNTSEASKSRKKRPRRNTDLSQEHIPPSSSRPSFEKSFSFRSRRSDPQETQSRDERILAARRKFEEKEANKDRKHEKDASKWKKSDPKKLGRQRPKSDAQPPLKSALKQVSGDGAAEKKKRRRSSIAIAVGSAEEEKAFQAKSYEDYRPSNVASLPRYGTTPGQSEKTMRSVSTPQPTHFEKIQDGGWMRFSIWFQTRMLSCGGRD